MTKQTDRRGFLSKTLLGTAGAGALYSVEEQILLAAMQDGTNPALANQAAPSPGQIPCGQIGKLKVSRMLMGGNLIGGWAHSRDLIYVSKLFTSYNTEPKVFETLELAEQQGINTIQLDPRCQDTMLKYQKQRGSKMQSLLCIAPDANETKMRDQIKMVIDKGATFLYTHGGVTDPLTMTGQYDVIGKAIDLMKAEGVPAGVGGHALETVVACEKQNLNPDFYVKTYHLDRYWSMSPEEKREPFCWFKPQKAGHGEYHDNMWCLNPDETVEFMAKVEKPWIAFKVLAAGAIPPRMGFSAAFRNGADFICVGMFDFQVAENVKIALDALAKTEDRKRPWRA
ncbi:MAG: hypothetical protein HUU20_10700 [Pirellulales bacterium]|nr:hypothetical protein [Pirellulales bacterium]